MPMASDSEKSSQERRNFLLRRVEKNYCFLMPPIIKDRGLSDHIVWEYRIVYDIFMQILMLPDNM